MQAFRCFVFDEDGHLFADEPVEATDDASAITIARAVFKSGFRGGYDLWQTDRHVLLEMNGAKLTLH
jgi:hypothetical protein